MTTTVSIDPVDARPSQRTATRSPWFGTAVWLSLTLLLCVTNVLTLLDQDFRNNAYNALARVAASPVLRTIGLDPVVRIVEEGSPAASERRAVERAVERATLRLVESTSILRREVTTLTDEKARLVMQGQDLQKRMSASQAAVATHKQRISTLGMRVAGRAGRSVTRHLAALPGHALPVLSATVAVGGGALDIHDACESLKELDELHHSVGLAPVNRSNVCGRAVPTAEELLADARDNWRKVYQTSAEALNAGAQMIPRSPPSISFESAQKWLFSTFGR
ncbi:hypothetical protein [Massilia sp.]|uniref:hypothetical protein n=1 Tax=Massilia sp. TaxID=1882437 RepID=UPI00289A779A|nr:hypothetical protein [Massilia sp.]